MPRTLLLADDSITIQKVVGITFANEDFQIVSVDNGEDAVHKAAEIKPDIVLADIVMPKLDGYQVCEKIKANPALRHIPVLLLTGAFKAFDENRSRQVAADGHIAKPFDSQALIDKVKELIARAAERAKAPPAPAPAPAPMMAPPPVMPPPMAAPAPVMAPVMAPPPPSAPVASPASSLSTSSPSFATFSQDADPFATPSERGLPPMAPPAPVSPMTDPFGSFDDVTQPFKPETEVPSPMELSMFEGIPHTPPASSMPAIPAEVPENIWDVPQAAAPIPTPAAMPPMEDAGNPFSFTAPVTPAAPAAPAPSPFSAPAAQAFSPPPVVSPEETDWSAAPSPFEMPKEPAFPTTPVMDLPMDVAPMDAPLDPPAVEPSMLGYEADFSSEPPEEAPPTIEPLAAWANLETLEPQSKPAPSFEPVAPMVPHAPSSISAGEASIPLDMSDLKTMTRDVIEKIAWEIIPDLAEAIIREELERLKKEKGVFT